MADWATPTAVANQALDAAAIDFFLGDIQEGTRPAQVCLRAYTECLSQLLRAAPWDFARKQAPLVLLADATGQTPNVGTLVPGSQFIYEYAYPTDCAKLRYIPWNPFFTPATPPGNITPPDPTAPVVTGLGNPLTGQAVVPARFLLTADPNYIPPGAANDTPGISPIGRTVILCNVPQAQAVYTFDATYPNVWDHQFRAALVAYLASEIAIPLAKDKKMGMMMQDRLIGQAKEKIKQARITDGQEGWHTSDLGVDWMRTRNTGGRGYGWGQADVGPGGYGCWGASSWAGSITMGNGSAY